jgi:hypothetical protein
MRDACNTVVAKPVSRKFHATPYRWLRKLRFVAERWSRGRTARRCADHRCTARVAKWVGGNGLEALQFIRTVAPTPSPCADAYFLSSFPNLGCRFALIKHTPGHLAHCVYHLALARRPTRSRMRQATGEPRGVQGIACLVWVNARICARARRKIMRAVQCISPPCVRQTFHASSGKV